MSTSNMHISATIDGATFDVTTITADMIRYEMTASREGWPTMDAGGAITGAAFMAWAAAVRTKKWSGKWSEWRDQLEDIDFDADEVDPTETAPEAV